MQSEKSDRLARTLQLIFIPVSKLLIRYNIPFRSAVEALKVALVSSASSDPQASDSLISLKTGIHRKDVRRLRDASGLEVKRKPPISSIAIVMSAWFTRTEFVNSDRKPRLLVRKTGTADPGFDDLVRLCKVDLAPATVLAELKAQELVAQHPDGNIELLSKTFLPATDDAALEAFDATISDHIRIAVENTTAASGAPRQFDQVVRYSHLSEQSVKDLEDVARERARAYLEDLNTMALKLQMADAETGADQSGRFVSGVFVAPTTTSDTEDQDPSDR